MTSLYVSGIRLKKGSGYDETLYPFALPVVRNLDVLRLDSPVTFFIGENGAGKSTLLEAVAVGYGFNAEGGSRNFHFATAETHSELYKHIVLEKGVKRPKDGYFLRAESFITSPARSTGWALRIPTAGSRSTAVPMGRAS